MSADILGRNCDQCRSMVQCCFTSTENVRLIRPESPGWPPRLSHSSWTLKWKFGKNGISFSRPWKSMKTEWGLWKFVNFVVFRALGKNYQLIRQKLHFPRPNSSLFFVYFLIAVQNHRECTSCQFWLIECVGHWLQQGLRPFTGCVEELRTFVLLFHTILQRFVNFERIFLYEPCKWALSTARIRSLNNTVLLSRQGDKSSEDSITAQFAHSCQCIVRQAATILVTLCILFFLLS